MAEQNLTDQADIYTRDDLMKGIQNVAQAMAILQAVRVAVDAVEGGAACFDSNDVSRWVFAVSAAANRVCRVRDGLIEKAQAPNVDWYTPLSLLEALDSALWSSGQAEDGDELRMTPKDVMTMTQAINEDLDKLAQELDRSADVAEGVLGGHIEPAQWEPAA